jgi:hypothetical protein
MKQGKSGDSGEERWVFFEMDDDLVADGRNKNGTGPLNEIFFRK